MLVMKGVFAASDRLLVRGLCLKRSRRGASKPRIMQLTGPGIEGWIAVYVDDILVAARRSLAEAVLKAISDCWECSTPQEVSKT